MNGNDNQMSEKGALMKKIQALSFAMVETELFLDTHPNCRHALDYYKDLRDNYRAATEEYSARFTPITSGMITGCEWKWAMGEWPWQIGKEG